MLESESLTMLHTGLSNLIVPSSPASVPCSALELYMASRIVHALRAPLCLYAAAPLGSNGLPLPTPIYLKKTNKMGLRFVSSRNPSLMSLIQ